MDRAGRGQSRAATASDVSFRVADYGGLWRERAGDTPQDEPAIGETQPQMQIDTDAEPDRLQKETKAAKHSEESH